MKQVLLGFLLYMLAVVCYPASSQSFECPAIQTQMEMVDFNAPSCREISLADYRMFSEAVWLRFSIELTASQLETSKPLGLFVSGNMSADAYFNGVYVGSKGTASLTKENELAGPFDWVGFLDPAIVKEGNNTLVLFVSSHQNILSNRGQFNRLYVSDFISTTDVYNKHYGLTLIPLGAMLIALAYLLGLRMKKISQRSSKRLTFLITIAIVQWVAEVSRGYYSYPYYLHEIRLSIIVVCAFLFGQCLLFYFLRDLLRFERVRIAVLSVVITLTSQLFVDDFDLKAIIAFQVPAAIGLIVLLLQKLHTVKSIEGILTNFFLIIFTTILAVTLLAPNDFLDSYFYFFIAIIVVVLTTLESRNRFQIEGELFKVKQQAEKLQLTLASKKESGKVLNVKSAGQTILVPVRSIIFCKAAGDYVELVCKDQSVLFSGSLQRLIDELTSGFLKVHRSYIVNAKYITELKRMPSGNGELQLAQGHRVPVSRAMFTKTRETIAEL